MGGWVSAARSQAQAIDKRAGWGGYVFEAGQFARLKEEGRLLGVNDRVEFAGTAQGVQVDAWGRADSGRMVLTELKKGSVSPEELPQFRKQVDYVVGAADKGAIERAIDWRIGGQVDPAFHTEAVKYAEDRGIVVRFLDAEGTPITTFTPVVRG